MSDTNNKPISFKIPIIVLIVLFFVSVYVKSLRILGPFAVYGLIGVIIARAIYRKKYAAKNGDLKIVKDKPKSKEQSEIDWAYVFNLKQEGPGVITHEVKKELVKEDTWPFDCPIVDYRIVYEAASGELTERNIKVLNFCRFQTRYNYSHDIYIKAFCHLRNEERTFNVSNIRSAWINDIPIYDVEHYFASIGEGTVAWQGIKAISSCYDEARMLIFFARAVSEILQKKHREMIVQYVLETALDAPFDAVSEELKRITCSMNDFNRLLKNNKIPDERKPKFIDCAKSIFLSRKEPDPIQEAMLKKIEKALNV